jgi:1,4-dihydroxy-2-naphthoyl-CoA hydrolase
MNIIDMLQERSKGLFHAHLGIEYLEAGPERIQARLSVRPDLCTAGNILHGGALMAFADTLGAVATVLNLSQDARTATIESKTNFMKAAPVGSTVIGDCTPLHRGRRTMTWQTRVTTEDGKLIALVIQTQIVIEP